MCDCLEEKQRKERERAQRLAARGFRGGLYGPSGGAYDGVGPDGGAFGPEGRFDEHGNWVPPRDPPSRFTPVRILLGTAGLLLALLALFLKTADTTNSHTNSSFLHKFCNSYLAPKSPGRKDSTTANRCFDPNPSNYCFDPKKKKWPKEPTDKD